MASAAPMVSSPRSPTASTFRNPRAAPFSQGNTAKIWDQYEREAVENVRRRERTRSAPKLQSCSESEVDNDHGKQPSVTIATAARISFDFNFGDTSASPPVSPMDFCKLCRQSVSNASGVCERCMKTTTRPRATGVLTPPVSPTTPNFPWSDNAQKRATSSSSMSNSTRSASYQCASFSPFPPITLVDPPVRQSSLYPPPRRDSSATQHSSNSINSISNRKASLTDPNEPFLRLQVAYSHPLPSPSYPPSPSFPPSPILPSTNTRPSTSHSHKNAYHFGNTTFLATPHSSTLHSSVAPSEPSPTRPCISTATSPPIGSHRMSNAVHNISSVWDDWNSDGEEEQVRLVSWKSVRSARSARRSKENKESREKEKDKETERDKDKDKDGPNSSTESSDKEKKASGETDDETKGVAKGKEEVGRDERVRLNGEKSNDLEGEERSGERGKRAGGFVRLVSCGC